MHSQKHLLQRDVLEGVVVDANLQQEGHLSVGGTESRGHIGEGSCHAEILHQGVES